MSPFGLMLTSETGMQSNSYDEIQKILFRELVLGKVSREWPLQDIFEKADSVFPSSSVNRDRPNHDTKPTTR